MDLKDTALHYGRQAKHQAFVAQKRARFLTTQAKWAAINLAAQATRHRPYTYNPSRYRRSFLNRPAPATSIGALPVRVFAVWTGDNELTPNRAKNLERLKAELGVPLILVTPKNLQEWVLDSHPLHPAYQHLSLIHKSDYLRAYLMHHHGGGYVDIKRPLHPWTEAFTRLQSDPDAWVASFPEAKAQDPARLPGKLGEDIALHFTKLVGCSSMIARPGSPFTAEWLREVERRLDYFAPQLQEFPGGIRGERVGYPISWTDVLGKIYHPLQLKYLPHMRQMQDLLLEFKDYQ